MSSTLFCVPDDLVVSEGHQIRHLECQGSMVSYSTMKHTFGVRVLVTQTTLVYVCKGSKEISRGNGTESLTVAAGEFVLILPGVHMMSERVAKSPGEEGGYQSLVLSFPDELVVGLLAPHLMAKSPRSSWPKDKMKSCTPGAYLGVVLAHLPHQIEHLPAPALIRLKLQEILLGAYYSEAKSLVEESFFWASSVGDNRLRLVVERHRYEPCTAAQLARQCGRSESSFKRDFKRIYGTSPGRWFSQTRLDRACALLKAGASVTSACFDVGFGDLSHFIRSFRHRYEVTPKQYQLQHAKCAPKGGGS